MPDLRFADGFFTVAGGLVRGPTGYGGWSLREIDDEVPAFLAADGFGPPELEKVAWPVVLEGSEADPAVEVGEELGCSGAVGIPAAEDLLSVFHIEISQTVE